MVIVIGADTVVAPKLSNAFAVNEYVPAGIPGPTAA
jgi:hypothetical protein